MRQRLVGLLGLVVLGAALAACSDSDGAGPPPPATSDFDQAEPGVVKGKAVSLRGEALADVEITVSGTVFASGETSTFRTRTAADGTYALRVPDGAYRLWGYHEATYAGARYCMPLALPTAGDYDSFGSKQGAVRLLTWRISGMRADETDPASPLSYFGGYVRLAANSWDGWSVGERFRVTFTPTGPLIDGSTGGVITREATVGEDEEAHLLDIPIGQYTVSAVQLGSAGETTPIKLDDLSDEPAQSLALVFSPVGSCSPLNGVQDVVLFAKK